MGRWSTISVLARCSFPFLTSPWPFLLLVRVRGKDASSRRGSSGSSIASRGSSSRTTTALALSSPSVMFFCCGGILDLELSVDEVSEKRLLSLVKQRLIDPNSNVNNKDAGYVENQQQNVADAIDLLPRLPFGIDVNDRWL